MGRRLHNLRRCAVLLLQPLSRPLRTLLAVALLALALPGVASAAVYTPKPKVLYHDGHTARYLMDGTWYFRSDPLDQGLAQGFERQRSLTGWTPVSVPNAWNATDLSHASQRGGVGWYRTDFRTPKTGHGVRWALRVDSVNYRPRVSLNRHANRRHAAAIPPLEAPASH